MIIRSKAPLRLGLAGGGTDLSPYCDEFGGSVLNVSIDLYATCIIEEQTNGEVLFEASDMNLIFSSKPKMFFELDGNLDLHKGVYNRIVRDFNSGKPLPLKMTTYSDAPPGSGLGSSSTMVVSMVKAYTEWLNLPLGEYDIARLAYEIERIDVGLGGGKQDQYAATFGGFNFIEFYSEDRVIVNPLRIKNWIKDELEASMMLYYTDISRFSADIIKEQKDNVMKKSPEALLAMHELKSASLKMKEALLNGNIRTFASLLNKSWNDKKKTAQAITNNFLEEIYSTAIDAGALAGKVSGAGGGGYMMFIVDPVKKIKVMNALNQFGGKVLNVHFSEGGCHGWKIF
jgi:D-glycero-alpha-D-manno-heptose-7-phosphate kinase